MCNVARGTLGRGMIRAIVIGASGGIGSALADGAWRRAEPR